MNNMKIVQLNTGLFPDAQTAEAALRQIGRDPCGTKSSILTRQDSEGKRLGRGNTGNTRRRPGHQHLKSITQLRWRRLT